MPLIWEYLLWKHCEMCSWCTAFYYLIWNLSIVCPVWFDSEWTQSIESSELPKSVLILLCSFTFLFLYIKNNLFFWCKHYFRHPKCLKAYEGQSTCWLKIFPNLKLKYVSTRTFCAGNIDRSCVLWRLRPWLSKSGDFSYHVPVWPPAR